jgi:hypothetical protein
MHPGRIGHHVRVGDPLIDAADDLQAARDRVEQARDDERTAQADVRAARARMHREVCAAYERGESQKSIAARARVERNQVYKILKGAGLI